jgi:hypothetical protein
MTSKKLCLDPSSTPTSWESDPSIDQEVRHTPFLRRARPRAVNYLARANPLTRPLARAIAFQAGVVDLDLALATRANEDGQRLLHWVCCGGRVELATGLLDRGSDVHARDSDGEEALLYASRYGHLPVATLLLDRGADPCIRNDDWTALGVAASDGHHPVVLLLLSRGADLAATMRGGWGQELKTALEWCGQRVYPRLSDKHLEQRREEMRAAFAAGPHPSQVQRRRDENWERRAAFVSVLVLSGLQPLAARREQLAAAALPHDVPIPRLPDETPAQRLGNLRAKVFAHEKIWRDVAAFL